MSLLSKKILVLLITLGLVFWGRPAESAWLIDGVRWHLSAHGEYSCLECHQDHKSHLGHPDQERVKRSLKDFFQTDRCYDCHDSVKSDLDKGIHGRRTVTDPELFQECIRCHNPHYAGQRSPAKKNAAKRDPSRTGKCINCHEDRSLLPTPAKDVADCYRCHVITSDNPIQRRQQVKELCGSCHLPSGRPLPGTPRFDFQDLTTGPHGNLDCLACHVQGARFRHHEQDPPDCRTCHRKRHAEKVAHDAHFGVACSACHLEGMAIERDSHGRVQARSVKGPEVIRVHRLAKAGEEASCRRCHTINNQVGAAAMALPAKSVICMPCHPATLSAGDTITIVSLVVFVLGLTAAVSFWRSGSGPPPGLRHNYPHQPKIKRWASLLETLVLDGLGQRRLWQVSPIRGLIHSLIFWPFVVRCLWGLTGLVATTWFPQAAWGWDLINKNHPMTAWVFDITGLMVLVGAAGAIIRRRLHVDTLKTPDSPKPDWLALGLLLGLVVIGFVLEAMRIAMTGTPSGGGWAWIGYAFSGFFTAGEGLQAAYGYIWYSHALLTGFLVAYLPFSRLFHLILAPVVLARRALQGNH